jgi:hypothetical protein
MLAIMAISRAIMPTNRNLPMKPKSRLLLEAIALIAKKMMPVPTAA